MTVLRPIPHDFAAKNAELRDRDKLAKHYKASRKTIFRWRQEMGIPPSSATAPTPIPVDFVERCAEMNRRELGDHYGASYKLITRWLEESGAIPLIVTRKPVPADFAERCARMTAAELARFYQCGNQLIYRWLRESGLSAKAYNPTQAIRTMVHTDRLNSIKVRDAAQEAAYKLQRLRPVYRCTETGIADITGKFWRAGNAVLTDAELIARAEKIAA